VEQNNTEATEQPAPEPDSSADGLQEGGLTPAVADALASLPVEQQTIVKDQIANQNSYITKTRQTLESQKRTLQKDVQMAGVMKELLKDSEFSAYLQHRERGSLPKFFQERSNSLNAGSNTPITESNPESSGFESPVEDSSVPASVDTDLDMRLRSIEHQQATSAAQVQIDEFSASHADYKEYLPLMYSARSRLPGASLEDLYHVAKGLAAAGVEPEVQPGVEVGQEQATQTVEEIATPVSPPPPVGAASSTSPAGTPASSIAEAFAKAKEQLGIDGSVHFQSS